MTFFSLLWVPMGAGGAETNTSQLMNGAFTSREKTGTHSHFNLCRPPSSPGLKPMKYFCLRYLLTKSCDMESRRTPHRWTSGQLHRIMKNTTRKHQWHQNSALAMNIRNLAIWFHTFFNSCYCTVVRKNPCDSLVWSGASGNTLGNDIRFIWGVA